MRRTDREVTDREKQMEILHVCKVARIGIQDGKSVYVVPVNFGFTIETDKLTMYVHGAKEGKKLDLIKENPYLRWTAKMNSLKEKLHVSTATIMQVLSAVARHLS